MNNEQQKESSPALGGARVRRVWFTMVLVPSKGWTRVGKAYGSEKAARSWLGFVCGAWHGLRTKTAQCTLRWTDGVMDERSRRTLSEKFNMEPPAAPPNAPGSP
jgi:hypothetical protein